MNKQNTNPTKSVGLIQNRPDHDFMATLTCSRHNIVEKIVELSLNNNHSLTHSIYPMMFGSVALYVCVIYRFLEYSSNRKIQSTIKSVSIL